MNRSEMQIAAGLVTALLKARRFSTHAGVVELAGGPGAANAFRAVMALNAIMDLGGDPNGTEYEVEVVVRRKGGA